MSYTICSRFKGEHIVYAGYTICTSREHIVYGAFCGSTLLYCMYLISLSYFKHVCNFRRVQLSITVNIRHCMRMNNFLSEADLASINICFNQNYK